MSYPSFSDYETAVSRPADFFSDADIRGRMAVTDARGAPTQFSGAYAFTFKFAAASKTPIAVRCFKVEITDLVERYRAIELFLNQLASEFFVGFAVSAPYAGAKAGVFVAGRWLPVMRMDWIDGVSLGSHVEMLLRTEDWKGLRAVRASISRFAALSEAQGFAHGDIHPDNIIVCDGQLKFVDYDGMYVPALQGRQSPLAGQEDFQSPLRIRDPTVFGPWLDRFSLMLIDLSLAALERSPGLLTSKTAGEGLLLGRNDFQAPQTSRLLAKIETLPGLSEMVAQFRRACSMPLEKLPTLASFQALEIRPKRRPLRTVKRSTLVAYERARSIADGLRHARIVLSRPLGKPLMIVSGIVLMISVLLLYLQALPLSARHIGVPPWVAQWFQPTPYNEGLRARQEWEAWIGGLRTTEARAGANFWASQRSLAKPMTCESQRRSAEFRTYCEAAKSRLTPTDVRRHLDPTYRSGWNSYIQ